MSEDRPYKNRDLPDIMRSANFQLEQGNIALGDDTLDYKQDASEMLSLLGQELETRLRKNEISDEATQEQVHNLLDAIADFHDKVKPKTGPAIEKQMEGIFGDQGTEPQQQDALLAQTNNGVDIFEGQLPPGVQVEGLEPLESRSTQQPEQLGVDGQPVAWEMKGNPRTLDEINYNQPQQVASAAPQAPRRDEPLWPMDGDAPSTKRNTGTSAPDFSHLIAQDTMPTYQSAQANRGEELPPQAAPQQVAQANKGPDLW